MNFDLNIIRLNKKKHIAKEWLDEDGYWVELKSGFKCGNDPLGVVHTIHEDTKKQAYMQGVMQCHCPACVQI